MIKNDFISRFIHTICKFLVSRCRSVWEEDSFMAMPLDILPLQFREPESTQDAFVT